MNYSGTWTSDETDEELVLVFKDKKKQKRYRYCLVLQEYDGKGVFILRNKDDPKNPIVGLKQIVHFIRRPELLSHPHTIRDILRQYVVRKITYASCILLFLKGAYVGGSVNF